MRIGIYILIGLTFLTTIISYGQSSIKGNIKIYNSEMHPMGIKVLVSKILPNNDLIGTTTDSSGYFILKTIPNGKIDLQFSFIGCYNTIVKDIELKNDSIQLQNIPVFESNYTLNWDGICEKRLLWGLIKYKKGCGGTDTIERSQFPANNKIYIGCSKSETDSILFELNPQTKNIEVKYEALKSVW